MGGTFSKRIQPGVVITECVEDAGATVCVVETAILVEPQFNFINFGEVTDGVRAGAEAFAAKLRAAGITVTGSPSPTLVPTSVLTHADDNPATVSGITAGYIHLPDCFLSESDAKAKVAASGRVRKYVTDNCATGLRVTPNPGTRTIAVEVDMYPTARLTKLHTPQPKAFTFMIEFSTETVAAATRAINDVDDFPRMSPVIGGKLLATTWRVFPDGKTSEKRADTQMEMSVENGSNDLYLEFTLPGPGEFGLFNLKADFARVKEATTMLTSSPTEVTRIPIREVPVIAVTSVSPLTANLLAMVRPVVGQRLRALLTSPAIRTFDMWNHADASRGPFSEVAPHHIVTVLVTKQGSRDCYTFIAEDAKADVDVDVTFSTTDQQLADLPPNTPAIVVATPRSSIM